ncbi:MAG TPA: hypothetical protein VI138_08020, partial [Candidatus Dormibacteraeota bacterium]
MAASLWLTAPAGASYASEIAALKAQEQQLIGQLQSLQGQAGAAGQQAAATQQQMAVVQQQLTQDQTKLSQVNAALTQTTNQLAVTQAQMAKDRGQLADLVTILYQRDSSDSLAAAIANTSTISKLVDATVDLQTVRQQFDSLTKQLISDANALKRLQTQQQLEEKQVTALVDSVQSQENQLQSEESAYSAEQSDLTGQAATVSSQIQQVSSQVVLLEEEAGATQRGGGSGPEGLILNTCSGCYTGPDLAEDDYTPIGQCTWFVATHAYISWRANADGWIQGDAAAGPQYPIGDTP